MTAILQMLQEHGVSFVEQLKNQVPLLEKLCSLKTIYEIEDWFMDSLVRPAIEILDIERKNNSITEQVLRIIHEEYDSNLSLNVCAERLNYNPQHISRVFRKDMGMGFGEYLMIYRLEMAKKWLRETNMKIGNISQRLRYCNTQNFIRFFKSVEGLTPSHYRQQNKMVKMN